MLGAAFPRASWDRATEAVYVMAFMDEDLAPSAVQQTVRMLIREEEQLPTPAKVIRRCRELDPTSIITWSCPQCGSPRIVGLLDGPGWCPDCDWEGTL